MSNRIFQAVWDFGPETRTEMLVLMALADCADASSAECFPGLDHIRHAARASRRTVVDTLKALEADGWITVEKRLRPNGSQASNLYRINIEKLGLPPLPVRSAAKGGAKTAPHGGAETARGGVQKLHPTGGAKTAPLEQTIYNKGPAALDMDFKRVTAFQRSSLLAGRSVVIAGQLVEPASPQAASLLAALRSEDAEKGSSHV